MSNDVVHENAFIHYTLKPIIVSISIKLLILSVFILSLLAPFRGQQFWYWFFFLVLGLVPEQEEQRETTEAGPDAI